MIHQLVLIHYVDNRVNFARQQLLKVHLIKDLESFSNSDMDRFVDDFVAHNFDLDPTWDLYYYITGLNDSKTPFYYRQVRDCVLSPFTAGPTPRFTTTADDADAVATSGGENSTEGSFVPPIDPQGTSHPGLSESDDDEPDAMLDKLMHEKGKEWMNRRDDHEN